MNELLDKISSYNLFNYLLPGILFAVIGSTLTGYGLVHHDVLISLFVCYFYGLVISRVGSLVLEPLLKRIRFVTFAPYETFVAASHTDPKLEVLSEMNNTYRTLTALMACLLALGLVKSAFDRLALGPEVELVICLLLLLALFAFSYRKQTAYIAQRVSGGAAPVKSDPGRGSAP